MIEAVLIGVAVAFMIGVTLYEIVTRRSVASGDESRRPVYWISVEGCIGVGKSTLIKAWRPHLESLCSALGNWQLVVVEEPLPPAMLEAIKEQHRSPHHAYYAQTMFFNLRHSAFMDAFKGADPSRPLLIVSERSFMSDRIFWNVQNEERALPEGIRQTYLDLWSKWAAIYPTRPSLVLKLTTSIDTMMERVHHRNRDAESALQAEYQQRLFCHHAMHDEYFPGCKVLERDTTGRFDDQFIDDLMSALRRTMAS